MRRKTNGSENPTSQSNGTIAHSSSKVPLGGMPKNQAASLDDSAWSQCACLLSANLNHELRRMSVALLRTSCAGTCSTETMLRQAGLAIAGFDNLETLLNSISRGLIDAVVYEIANQNNKWRAQIKKLRFSLPPSMWLLAIGSGCELAVPALEAGADEYFNHPLHLSLVRSRTAAAFRRQHNLLGEHRIVSCGPYVLDLPSLTLKFQNASVLLTPREANLLALFFASPGLTIPRTVLAQSGGVAETETSHAMEQQLYQLRRKLRRIAPELALRSSYGKGYILHVSTC
jgi:DNA-binding response OmpR family regulator